MKKDTGGTKRYETPVVVQLGEITRGTGDYCPSGNCPSYCLYQNCPNLICQGNVVVCAPSQNK